MAAKKLVHGNFTFSLRCYNFGSYKICMHIPIWQHWYTICSSRVDRNGLDLMMQYLEGTCFGSVMVSFQKRCCGYSSHFFLKHGQKSTFYNISCFISTIFLVNPISLVDEYSVCKWSKSTFGNCTNVSVPPLLWYYLRWVLQGVQDQILQK